MWQLSTQNEDVVTEALLAAGLALRLSRASMEYRLRISFSRPLLSARLRARRMPYMRLHCMLARASCNSNSALSALNATPAVPHPGHGLAKVFGSFTAFNTSGTSGCPVSRYTSMVRCELWGHQTIDREEWRLERCCEKASVLERSLS